VRPAEKSFVGGDCRSSHRKTRIRPPSTPVARVASISRERVSPPGIGRAGHAVTSLPHAPADGMFVHARLQGNTSRRKLSDKNEFYYGRATAAKRVASTQGRQAVNDRPQDKSIGRTGVEGAAASMPDAISNDQVNSQPGRRESSWPMCTTLQYVFHDHPAGRAARVADAITCRARAYIDLAVRPESQSAAAIRPSSCERPSTALHRKMLHRHSEGHRHSTPPPCWGRGYHAEAALSRQPDLVGGVTRVHQQHAS